MDYATYLETVNAAFNVGLRALAPENANSVILSLGRPSDILRSAGIEDKEIRLYGNKVLKKAKKHGFEPSVLVDLPKAVSNPIFIFDDKEHGGYSVLTELNFRNNHILTAFGVGNGSDVIFNIVKSTFGKSGSGIVCWINNGTLLYADKEKALNYLRSPALLAGATDSQELTNALRTVSGFENPERPFINIGDFPEKVNTRL